MKKEIFELLDEYIDVKLIIFSIKRNRRRRLYNNQLLPKRKK